MRLLGGVRAASILFQLHRLSCIISKISGGGNGLTSLAHLGGGSWTAYNSGGKSCSWTNGGQDVAAQAGSPNCPVRGGEDGGWGRGWQPCVATFGTKRENPFGFGEWTGPGGRHDAPSPQSSVRRS